jgi:hypothetical protein
MGRFGSGLYYGCLNAPKKKLHPNKAAEFDEWEKISNELKDNEEHRSKLLGIS